MRPRTKSMATILDPTSMPAKSTESDISVVTGWLHWGTGRACYVVPPATNHQEQHKDPNKPGRCTVWVRELNVWKVKSLLIKCQSLLHQWKVSFLPSRWSFFGVSWGFCFMGKYGKVAKNGRQIIISWFLSFSRWKIQVNNFCCTGDLVQIFHQFGPIMSSHHDIHHIPSYPLFPPWIWTRSYFSWPIGSTWRLNEHGNPGPLPGGRTFRTGNCNRTQHPRNQLGQLGQLAVKFQTYPTALSLSSWQQQNLQLQ